MHLDADQSAGSGSQEKHTQALPRKLWPEAQSRTWKGKRQQRFQGRLGRWWQCGAVQIAALTGTEIDVSNTAKAVSCPKSYWTQRHPKTYCWTLHCPSERWDPAPSTRTQVQVPLTRKPSQDIINRNHGGSTLNLRENKIMRIFSFSFFWTTMFIPLEYFLSLH